MVTLEQFAKDVQQMRHTQRRARKFGKPELYARLEKEEAKVDEQLRELFSTQLSLF